LNLFLTFCLWANEKKIENCNDKKREYHAPRTAARLSLKYQVGNDHFTSVNLVKHNEWLFSRKTANYHSGGKTTIIIAFFRPFFSDKTDICISNHFRE
jgi:hypothetical protein